MTGPRPASLAAAVILLAMAVPALALETGVGCVDGLDDDADGLVDCQDPDCGSAATPAEVTSLTVRRSLGDPDFVRLAWSDVRTEAGWATAHDIVIGSLHDLREDRDLRRAGCLFDSLLGGPLLHATGHVADVDDGLDASYYLVRAENACGTGTLGTDSFGVPRRDDDSPCLPGREPAGCGGGPTAGTVSVWTPCDVYSVNEQVPVFVTNDGGGEVSSFESSCWPWLELEELDRGTWRPAPSMDWVCADWCDSAIPLSPGTTVEDASLSRGFYLMQPGGTYRVALEVGLGPCAPFEPCGASPADCADRQVLHSAPFLIVP